MRAGIFLVGATLLAAIAPAQAQTPRNTLTIGMVQFPPDLHPYITDTSIKDTVLLAANRPMVGYASDGSVICLLCTEIPTLQNGGAKLIKRDDGTDGMEVTYTLKPDLFWGDGVQVTAKDFAFSFQVSSTFNPPQVIESVVAVDPLHVKFVLKSTQYDYQRVANSMSGAAVLPEHIEAPIFAKATSPLDYGQKSAFNTQANNPGLWLGPYRVADYQRSGMVILLPNEYWKGPVPYFKKVQMRLVENTAALQANILAGDVDTVASGNLGLTLDQIISMSKTTADRFDFNFIPSVASYEHLSLNLDNKFLSQRRIRQIIAMAIDRGTIVNRLFADRFQVADSYVHPTQFGYDTDTKKWPYDPKKARFMLEEMGFKPGPDGIMRSPEGEKFSLDLTTTAGNHARELVEQVIQTELKAIGIELVIKNQPAREMFGETLRKRNFNGIVMFQTDMALDYVPLIYFHTLYIPSAENSYSGLNYMDWRNPAVDAAIISARAELDPEKRREMSKTIQGQYVYDLPEIPLYFPATGLITPKWMTGIYNPQRYGFITSWIEQWRAR